MIGVIDVIQKQRTGKGFAGILRYCLDQSRELGHAGAHIIDTDLAGRDADELARELEAVAGLRPRVEKPVYHVSLRLAPGERLDDERWRAIARAYLDGMGFGEDRGYVVIAHPGAKHDPQAGHVHIIANRVPYDGGKVWRDSHDYARSERVVRRLEREHHLQPAREKDREYGRDMERTRDTGRWEE
jgi:hypothetical protein